MPPDLTTVALAVAPESTTKVPPRLTSAPLSMVPLVSSITPLRTFQVSIFCSDGIAASGADVNAAMSADLDAAGEDDAAVNRNPALGRENDAAINDRALDRAGGDAGSQSTCPGNKSWCWRYAPVRIVLETTTMPPDR